MVQNKITKYKRYNSNILTLQFLTQTLVLIQFQIQTLILIQSLNKVNKTIGLLRKLHNILPRSAYD